MKEALKQFIEHNINLIDLEDWETLYSIVDDSQFLGCELTTCLLSAGLDPLRSINFIPEGYLQGWEGKEFHIPDHIIEIKEYAFLGSEIKKLYIGKSLNKINLYAFDECEFIEQVHISSLEQWCNLNFEGMTAHPLHFDQGILYVNGRELNGRVEIPEGIKKLGAACFEYGNSIATLVLPKSLIEIVERDSLPYNCKIEYRGTKEEFSKILLPSQSRWNNIDFMKISEINCVDGALRL